MTTAWRYAGILVSLALALASVRAGDGGRTPGERRVAAKPSRTTWAVLGAEGSGDPRLEVLLDVLERARRSAVESLAGMWSLGPASLPIAWELDASSSPPSKREAARSRSFEAGITRVGSESITIRIPARRYLARPEKAHAVVLHEAAHAFLASRLGSRERYEALPFWFREGLALAVSGEGDERVGAVYGFALARGDAAPPDFTRLDGEAAPVAGYLALRALGDGGRRAGARVLRHLVDDVASRRPFDSAWRRAVREAGLEDEGALARAAEDFLARIVPPAAAIRFRDAVASLRRGDAAGSLPLLESLHDPSVSGVLVSSVRYFHARALALEGRDRDALSCIAEALAAELEGPWEAESLVLGARAARRLEDPERGRGFAEEVLERFPEDPAAREQANRLLGELAGAPAP